MAAWEEGREEKRKNERRSRREEKRRGEKEGERRREKVIRGQRQEGRSPASYSVNNSALDLYLMHRPILTYKLL